MRMQNYLSQMDLSKRILEIGPLSNPILKKSEANVWYADIKSTHEVKEQHKNNANANQDAICEIDFAVRTNYTETCKGVEKFDYIISCHVLEHIPRLIDFFQDTVNILNPHGTMYAFLPDCRYCFDHFRTPTSFAELYYIHTQKLAWAPWQVLDSAAMGVSCNDPKLLASSKHLFPLLARRSSFAEAKAIFEESLAGTYRSLHYSTFTPASFLLLLHEMTRAGVLPYTLTDFFPTPPRSFTFGTVLEACPELPDSEELSEREMDKLRRMMARLVEYEASFTTKTPHIFSCLPPDMGADISRDALVALERHFGGIVQSVPRKRVSSHDPRTPAQLETSGMSGGDRMLHHGYGVHYARLLNDFFPNRDEKITIVEIGILQGSGLALWSHLYPEADIIGLDIDVHNFKENYSILRERGAFRKKDPELHEFDQFVDNRDALAAMLRGRKINLLIDDGAHVSNSILMTALSARGHLAEKFLYFVEDNDAVAQQLQQIFFDEACLSFGELTVIHSRDGKASAEAKRDSSG